MHHSISSGARNADALSAVWSGGERTDLPYLWLRDNCGCGECCVEQTREKRFHLFRVPRDLRPSSRSSIEGAGSEDEAISIAWPDGHLHTLPVERDPRPPEPASFRPAATGMAGSSRGSSIISGFLASDRAAAEVIEEFLRTGVCVLVEAPTEPDSLEQLATRLGPIREVLFERIHNVMIQHRAHGSGRRSA